jgi:hypothetical protein
MRSKFASISSKADAFCQRYLNDEYRQLVRTAVAALLFKTHRVIRNNCMSVRKKFPIKAGGEIVART